MMHGQKNIKLH